MCDVVVHFCFFRLWFSFFAEFQVNRRRDVPQTSPPVVVRGFIVRERLYKYCGLFMWFIEKIVTHSVINKLNAANKLHLSIFCCLSGSRSQGTESEGSFLQLFQRDGLKLAERRDSSSMSWVSGRHGLARKAGEASQAPVPLPKAFYNSAQQQLEQHLSSSVLLVWGLWFFRRRMQSPRRRPHKWATSFWAFTSVQWCICIRLQLNLQRLRKLRMLVDLTLILLVGENLLNVTERTEKQEQCNTSAEVMNITNLNQPEYDSWTKKRNIIRKPDTVTACYY